MLMSTFSPSFDVTLETDLTETDDSILVRPVEKGITSCQKVLYSQNSNGRLNLRCFHSYD